MKWVADASRWDEDKARLVAGAAPGVFDRRYSDLKIGDTIPGEWWRVEEEGRVIGYGWLDVVWGDAEILLVTDPDQRTHGVGSYILEQLENEARKRGLNYLYNVVRPSHPDGTAVSSWLQKRGFRASEDGSLLRALVPQRAG